MLFFAIDEYTDHASVSTVCEYRDVVMDALRSPHKERPKHEVILGVVAQQ